MNKPISVGAIVEATIRPKRKPHRYVVRDVQPCGRYWQLYLSSVDHVRKTTHHTIAIVSVKVIRDKFTIIAL